MTNGSARTFSVDPSIVTSQMQCLTVPKAPSSLLDNNRKGVQSSLSLNKGYKRDSAKTVSDFSAAKFFIGCGASLSSSKSKNE